MISQIQGVSTVSVDFDTKMATVDMKPGATLTEQAVTAAFKGSNYKVRSITEGP